MKKIEKKQKGEGINEYRIDVPVLLIFFCRSDKFEKVFEQVRIARPSKLYLYQDGPRNDADMPGILRCRDIADQIDWECEVHIWYQESNVGCDPSEYISQRWMFEQEEMGIVLEDDDVPSQSFFPFCKELLEKYKDDERINMICGMNSTDISQHVKESYLFTTKGSCWGWASWKRVVMQWDESYPWLASEQDMRNLQGQRLKKHEFKSLVNYVQQHKRSGKAHYETIGGMDLYLYNRLNIVPKYNMITNIGIGEGATHGPTSTKMLSRRSAMLFNKVRYEIEFPLKHPRYMMPDYVFEKQMRLIGPIQTQLDRVEVLIKRFIYKFKR